MEWLIGIAAFVAFIFWAVWQSGKQNGLQEAARKQAETNGKYERKIAQLEGENKSQSSQARALTATIRDAKAHISALRGDAVELLEKIRATRPRRISHAEAFLLLAPGTLHGYSAWARSASYVWRQVDQLSAQSRRALEEACLTHREPPAPVAFAISEDAPITPLLQDVLSIVEGRPQGVEFNLFDCVVYDFEELEQWFNTLALFSHSWVMRVAEVESRLRREGGEFAHFDTDSVPSS